MKRTVIFTDIALVPTFVLTFYSGIKLHVAGHGTSHEVWHNFALFHIITSLLFLAACIMHIRSHAAWYKGLFQKCLGKKSRITFWTTVAFILATSTGIVLLGVEGANSGIGMWHYRIGLTSSALMLIHISKRFIPLCSSLRKKH